jgi:hypothetical protein
MSEFPDFSTLQIAIDLIHGGVPSTNTVRIERQRSKGRQTETEKEMVTATA